MQEQDSFLEEQTKKLKTSISKGEVCVANFTPPPPANGAILGSYFVLKIQGYVDFFFQVKFATSLLALLAGG